MDAEKSGIRFPQAEKHTEKSGTKSNVAPSVASISNQEISKAIESALNRAKRTLLNLEMDQLLKKHSEWDCVKWNNASDCDVESDEDNDDSDDDNDKNTGSVVKDKEIEDEMVSAIVQEVCEDDPIEVEKI